MHWPDGKVDTYQGKESMHLKGVLIVHDWDLLNKLRTGAIGFAEGYLANYWSTPDISDLLEVLNLNLDEMQSHIGKNKIIKFITRLSHILRPNSRSGSKKNIYEHYDLGNNFYEKWLDPSMTYSSAILKNKKTSRPPSTKNGKSLAQSIGLKKNIISLRLVVVGAVLRNMQQLKLMPRTGLTISQVTIRLCLRPHTKKGCQIGQYQITRLQRCTR